MKHTVQDILRSPAYAFATAYLDRHPPKDAPPSPAGGEWTSVDWFSNCIFIRFGANISTATWAVTLDAVGVELRRHRGRVEARMSEHNCLDLLTHGVSPAIKASMRRFQLFSDQPVDEVMQ